MRAKEGAGIFSLKHESSIFKSFIQPYMWFWKCQARSPWDKQFRAYPVPSWRNHIQGCMTDLNMLLSCFREKMSAVCLLFFLLCFSLSSLDRRSISCLPVLYLQRTGCPNGPGTWYMVSDRLVLLKSPVHLIMSTCLSYRSSQRPLYTRFYFFWACLRDYRVRLQI